MDYYHLENYSITFHYSLQRCGINEVFQKCKNAYILDLYPFYYIHLFS
jgi:hypothetical protein